MKYGWLFLLCLSTLCGRAQDKGSSGLYRTAVAGVIINGGKQAGCGFVVGVTRDSLYIVTAHHVVRIANTHVAEKIEVQLAGGEKLPARVLHTFTERSQQTDIALLGVAYAGYGKPAYCSINNPAPGFDVYFLKGEERIKTPADEPGSIERWEDDDHQLYSIYLPEIKEGDSGSALFTREGIAGMVINTADVYARVLNITYVKQVVEKWGDNYWQLCAVDGAPPDGE